MLQMTNSFYHSEGSFSQVLLDHVSEVTKQAPERHVLVTWILNECNATRPLRHPDSLCLRVLLPRVDCPALFVLHKLSYVVI